MMKIIRAASGGLMGILCLLILQSCGGSSYGGGGSPSPDADNDQRAAHDGGRRTIRNHYVVGDCRLQLHRKRCVERNRTLERHADGYRRPAAGTDMYTLTCSGGAYSSNSKTATLTVTAASAFSVTNLVADNAAGNAMNVDANLVNPWGLSIPAGTDPAWIANNGTQTSTLYDGDGKSQPQPAANQLIVAFAASSGGTAFDPSGVVSNSSSTDFMVSAGASPVPPRSSSTARAA